MPPKAAVADPDHKEPGGRTKGLPQWTPGARREHGAPRPPLPAVHGGGPSVDGCCTNRCWCGAQHASRAANGCVVCRPQACLLAFIAANEAAQKQAVVQRGSVALTPYWLSSRHTGSVKWAQIW